MWDYLKRTDKPIVIYGMGNGADKIIDTLKLFGKIPYGVFASDDFVRGQNFRGFTVKKYSDFKEELGNFIVLVAFGTQREDVLENIRTINSEQELYAPDVPLFGDGLFTKEFAIQNKENLEKIYNLLADEQSKMVFLNTIMYRLTGQIQYLFDIETEEKEAFSSIIKPTDNEVYIDLGAYNGDTAIDFINLVGDYQKIICVEPDYKNFKKMQNRLNEYQNILLINKGIGETDKISFFQMSGGRNSSLSENGKEIKLTSVDSILSGEKATFIKYDIEGAELKGIEGAENTIKRFKPKMLVSAYHRTNDYFDIPIKILEIRDDYKIYMRHYKYIPAWDTQFYFI